jgi:hypothetical protein
MEPVVIAIRFRRRRRRRRMETNFFCGAPHWNFDFLNVFFKFILIVGSFKLFLVSRWGFFFAKSSEHEL